MFKAVTLSAFWSFKRHDRIRVQWPPTVCFRYLVLAVCLLVFNQTFISSPPNDSTSEEAMKVSQNFTDKITKQDGHAEWRQIFDGVFIFSVHQLVRQKAEIQGVIIVKSNDADFWSDTRCTCIFHGPKSIPAVAQQASLKAFTKLSLFSSENLTSGRLICAIPGSHVSLIKVTIQCDADKSSRSGNVAENLPPFSGKEFMKKNSYAQCGPVLHASNDNPAVIVEYVEYYRLMGVSKFFWYKTKISNGSQSVLDYYENIGVMDVVQLDFSSEDLSEIPNFDTDALTLDCSLRAGNAFDYLVFSNLDELFATIKRPSTFVKVMDNGRTDCALIQSAQMIPAHYKQQTDYLPPGRLFTGTVLQRESDISSHLSGLRFVCRINFINSFDINPILLSRNLTGSRPQIVWKNVSPEDTIVLRYPATYDGSFHGNVTEEHRAHRMHPNLLAKTVAEKFLAIFGGAEKIPRKPCEPCRARILKGNYGEKVVVKELSEVV